MNCKFYLVALALIGFVYSCSPGPVVTELETHKMQLYNIDNDTLSKERVHIIDAYYCEVSNNSKNDMPWANVFICALPDKADTVMVLDISDDSQSRPKDMDIYDYEIIRSAKYLRCRVKIPLDKVGYIKRLKYMYANVSLYAED